VRATQDLPETDRDVLARLHRTRKRMAARLHRPQSAQATPAPRRGMTAKGPAPGGQDPIDRQKSATLAPALHSRTPDLAFHEVFVRQAGLCSTHLGMNVRSCRRPGEVVT